MKKTIRNLTYLTLGFSGLYLGTACQTPSEEQSPIPQAVTSKKKSLEQERDYTLDDAIRALRELTKSLESSIGTMGKEVRGMRLPSEQQPYKK